MEYLREFDLFCRFIGSYIMYYGPFIFIGIVCLAICLLYPPLLILVLAMLIQMGFVLLSQWSGLVFVTWIPLMALFGFMIWGIIFYNILGKGK